MSVSDHHFLREDRASRWRRIAEHVKAHPEDLHIALENLDRWERLGRVHPAPIHTWRQLIEAAQQDAGKFDQLIEFLLAPNDDSEPIKSCSPFVGLPIPQSE